MAEQVVDEQMTPEDRNEVQDDETSQVDGSPVSEALFELRLQRIEEHRAQSLGSKDPLPAVLGTMSADLMVLQLQVAGGLQEAIGVGAATLDEIAKYRDAIEMQFKLAKHVTHISQLQCKLSKTTVRQNGQDGKSEESSI